MKKTIRRLRLREGDIVVVKDQQTMKNLIDTPISGVKFPCPVVFAPEGIKRANREYLLKILGVKETSG